MSYPRRALAAFAFAALLLVQLTGLAELALVRLVPQLQQLFDETKLGPPPVKAAGTYQATGGLLRTGSEMAITNAAASGNTGSWRGTLSPDGWGWGVSTPASAGLNQILYFDNVEVDGANKMVVSTYVSSGSASLVRYYQICDWVSTNKVDAAVDADCTGGGWRTLHKFNSTRKGRQGIAEAALRYYTWHIYDGYWNGNSVDDAITNDKAISTPLSNFVSSTGRVVLRAYSSSIVYTTHLFNWASIDLVVDPVYMPTGNVVITGNQTGESGYILAQSPPTLLSATGGTTGSDNGYLKVSGTAGITADFYVNFSGVRTFTGANSIAVVAEYGCSAAGINHRPKIFNFYSDAWEDLTASSIACSTTDAAGQFAFSTSSLWKYIRDGQVRVGWRGLSNGTQEVRLDYIYIIVGSTVTDTSRCEVSFGTGVNTQCDATTDMDSTLASSTGWVVLRELDSNTFGHDYYASDNDADAVAGEANVAVHLRFTARVPSTATLTGLAYAARFLSSSTPVTLQPQFRDFGGLNATAVGGFTNFGATAASTSTYAYTDAINSRYFVTSSEDYVDSYDDTIWVRFRTSASALYTVAYASSTFDYAMVSMRWIENTDTPRRTLQYEYTPSDGRLLAGTEMARMAAVTTGNIGSWRATLGAEANDGFGWAVTTTGTGLNQQLDFDHVQVRGANKMVVTLYASASAASLPYYYQICDWATTTAVDSAADSYCSGGWRTLNKSLSGQRVQFTDATRRTWTWPIYEGYWNVPLIANGTGTSDRIVSSTISNFVSSTEGIVRIRAYSTSTGGVRHMINYASLQVVVDPVYHPAGRFVVTGNGTGLSNYVNAVPPPTLISGGAGATGSDNNYMAVSGTASVTTEYYTKFRNVKTYNGMNAILLVAETGCSATGINYKLRVYNFTSPGWEDLSANIACGANGTDTTGQYVKGGININDYVSNGEVWVGILGSANGTQELRFDWMYIMLGTVNSDSANCRIDYGTNSSGSCTNTRTIDTSSAVSSWVVNTVQESAAMASDYFAMAGDVDATAEQLTSIVVPFTLTMATGTTPAGMLYAVRLYSGGAGMTLQPQYLDLGQSGAASGGFLNFGTTNASTSTYAYTDVISNGYFTVTPDDMNNGRASTTWVRFRASTITTVGLTLSSNFDFIMVSYRWVEDPNSTDITLTVDPTLALDAVQAGVGDVEVGFSFSVDSLNATGYTLGLKRNDANTTLDLISDGSQDITDKDEWVAPGATTTAGNAAAYTGTGLAFRVGEASDVPFFTANWWGLDSSPLYAGLPTTSQAVAIQSTPGTSNAKIFFRLAVPGGQTVGDYDG